MIGFNFHRFLPLILWTVGLASCTTTTKNFDHWASREIDRPYTLPDRIDSWTSEFTTKLTAKDNAVAFTGNSFNSFQWEQSLSDDWELIWSPLPLSVKYQSNYNRNGYVGFGFGVIPFYSSSSGWGVLPVGNLEYLAKLSENWAFKILGDGSVFAPFSGGAPTYMMSFGPEVLEQIDNNQSITFGTKALYTDFYKLGNFSISGVTSVPDNNLNISVGGHYLCSLGKQWNFGITWSYYLINASGINIDLWLVNYW